MDEYEEEDFKTQYIGHLGLVASKIHEMELISFIDSRLPISMENGAKVSMGERVAAMIMNGLGFIDSRLYLFPEFLSDKPVARLFGRELKVEWFNDDALGRCLDAIMSYGATKLYTEYALHIGEHRRLLGRSSHYTTTSHYKNVEQRWVMFFSKAAAVREIATLNKKVKQEQQGQEKAWWHLSNEMFQCATDAEKAMASLKKQLKYHEVETSIIEIKKHIRRGRPKMGDMPEVSGYQIQYQLKLNEAKLSCAELLREYKSQSGTEAGFKFIKNDAFEVDSIFLKTPERIVALMMVMTLCLMIYGVSEFDLRQTLQEQTETLPNQQKKQTNKPTMQWVYFLFRAVNELSIYQQGAIAQKMVINVNPLLRRIINYFGVHAQRIYFNSG